MTADEHIEQAREQFERGRIGDALKTLDSALWTAVGRFDWTTVASIERLLGEICPQTAQKDRRRCEYLLHAARENLHATAPEEEHVPPADDFGARIGRLERDVADLGDLVAHAELRMNSFELDLKTLVSRSRPTTMASAPAREAAPSPRPQARARPQPRVAATPAPKPRPAARPAPPPRPPRDWSQLFGPRTLAWAGGIVTSLGIVFLYSLAVNRGWIGPVVRVATGAVASALVFSAGFWLRRRFGPTYAALGAAGAGIVGGYATLLASVALYELLPEEIALFFAAGIAAIGVSTALLWSAEMVAGLGLVGAILAPVSLVFDDGFTALGTTFALVMLAAAALVALSRRWLGVLVSATAASAPQIAALVLDERGAAVVTLAALFSLAYLVGALAWNRRERALGVLEASLLLVSGAVASLASEQLFSGDARGTALLTAATVYGAVALERRWGAVLLGAGGASAVQFGALVLDERGAGMVLLAALFSLAYLAGALAWHRPERALGSITASLVLVSGSMASLASQQLFSGETRGAALLLAAGVYGAVAAALLPSPRRRDVSSLLAALALALAAVGLAQVISGQTLAIAWAAEAAVLAWLARRIGEERYQLGAIAYLALAAGHLLAVDAPLSDFFVVTARPAAGVATVAAVAVAALVLARYAGTWRARERQEEGVAALAAPVFVALREAQRLVRAVATLAAAVGAIYALSLAILDVAQRLGPDLQTAFERGHAAVDGTWSLLALALLAFSLTRARGGLATAALALYAVLFAKAVLFDVSELGETPRALALLAVAASAVLGGFLWQRLIVATPRVAAIAASLVAGSVAFGVPAALDLADGHFWRVDLDAVALFALAAAYGVLAAAAFGRERDLSSTLSAVALVLVAWGFWELVAGTWLVLAWAGVAVVVALLSVRTRDLRFLLASSGYVALALGHVLAIEAPPSDLFVSQRHPGGGVPALVGLAAAGLVFGLACRPWRRARPPEGDDPYGTRGLAYELESRLPRWRAGALAGTAIAVVLAVSLAILEAAEAASNVSVDTAFQRGHTGVSAFWAVLGLALLYVGLVRTRSALRVAGLALFAVTLAKIFLYDLAALSAIARALSFLAVGVLLLAAGFFYQRLTGRLEEREIPAQ